MGDLITWSPHWIGSLRKAVSFLLSIKHFRDSQYFSAVMARYFKRFQTLALRSGVLFSFVPLRSAAVVLVVIAVIDERQGSTLN